MADYFTHFSCLLDVGTPENAARALDLYNTLSEEGASEEPPPRASFVDPAEHGGTELWMRDDVTGDPERLIQFVKRCAAEFGLTGRWGFQYANTCSRPRLDGSAAARMSSTSPPARPWTGSTPMAGSPRPSPTRRPL
jgi:hypothetical protein